MSTTADDDSELYSVLQARYATLLREYDTLEGQHDAVLEQLANAKKENEEYEDTICDLRARLWNYE